MSGTGWQGDAAKDEVRRLLSVWAAWMGSASFHRLGYSADVSLRLRDDREVVSVDEAEAMRVELAMQRLKRINHQAFLPVVLLHGQGCEYVQAAGICRCSLPTFKSRLSDGLHFLMADLL